MQLSKNSNILILSHFYKRTIKGGGPPQEIRDYFLPKVKNIYYIEHPFPYSNDHRSSLSIYSNGNLQKKIFIFSTYGPDFLHYVLDSIFTFYFLIFAKTKFDLCIALDNLNTVSVIPFKKLGLIKKLVFYTIDYAPERFENKILNDIYHLIDRVACYNTDVIWILSKRMLTARIKNKVNIKKSAKSILLPMGAALKRIKTLPINKINRYNIVFVGHLLEKQGIQLVLETLPRIVTIIPNLKFIIIGQGIYEPDLKLITKRLKINKYVEFMGFVKDHNTVEDILCKSAIGIAPYLPSPSNATFYTDPGKPKLYLGCGLPVVITDVPAISRIIHSKKAGMIVNYNKESVAKTLIKLLSNDKLYKEYRGNAIKLSKNYDTDNLIEKALEKT